MQVEEYIAYLLSSPRNSSCVQAGDVLQVSHDEVNRFLLSGEYQGEDLFKAVASSIELTGGTLTVDDTVLDKPYTELSSTEVVGYFWSGKHHKAVKGINLIVLLYTTVSGYSVPVNFRVYRSSEGKTKNDYFQAMLQQVWQWGLRPAWITADSWYSSLENLKFLRNLEVNFMVGLEKNRIISTQPSLYEQVGQVAIPQEGLYTHLKGFDFITVFRTVCQEGDERHYALYESGHDRALPGLPARAEFEALRLRHWQVEAFFRCIKQCCQAEKFFVRNTTAIHTHLFCVMRAFQKLAALTLNNLIDSMYALHKMIFLQAQRLFIANFA
ncbi:transposase [Rhodocytophaga aerolata]|uniref:Transposase n=1 Tax=Rhodocytophaga aerolata TaxID=455078 RepID=A0ABT8R0L7_9BACT|nr:transposase [Rhodocytophaga aerolata]MDO1445635.1 transposase [Rhodocytophaga aerolata]